MLACASANAESEKLHTIVGVEVSWGGSVIADSGTCPGCRLTSGGGGGVAIPAEIGAELEVRNQGTPRAAFWLYENCSISSETWWCLGQEGGGLSPRKSMPNRKGARVSRRRCIWADIDGGSKGRRN